MYARELTDWPLNDRTWELNLLNPLVGKSMLELGNKVKVSPSGRMVYKKMFEGLGFVHTSVDMNGKDGALRVDLRKPLNLGTFDMVTNFGTTEHVSPENIEGQAACWRNICEAMHPGSIFVSVTPLPGAKKWEHHGAWYPTHEFFAELALFNGLEIERSYDDGNMVFARLRRVVDAPFKMPTNGMFKNKGWARSQDNII